jgi:HAD superfamily hydrolase (TIGR01450 family)
MKQVQPKDYVTIFCNELKREDIEFFLQHGITNYDQMGAIGSKKSKTPFETFLSSVGIRDRITVEEMQQVAEQMRLDDIEENPDIVVVGFDRELNYNKLEKACGFIDDGAIFLATNIDYVCPIKNKRYIPDCGSICMMIKNATGVEAKFIGKPEPDMINILKEKYNLNNNEIAMVGDRVYTDITCGYNANVFTICVLSGESTLETIEQSNIKPNLVVNSIKDLIDMI